jgi:hypothetical protein
MLKGGTKQSGTCDKCFEKITKEEDGVEQQRQVGHRDKTTDEWVFKLENQWIHNETHKDQCLKDQKAYHDRTKESFLKSVEEKKLEEKAAKAEQKAIQEKAANEVFLKNYTDMKKELIAKQLVSAEMERERLRFEALTEEQKEDEKNGDFFKFPDSGTTTMKQNIIIAKEKDYRRKYNKMQKKIKGARIKLVQETYPPSNRIVIVYSVNSINKINSDWEIPNEYSIEIHCTTFRPPNNPNDPSQNFYGHVTLNIYRDKDSQTGVINSEKYHYGVYPEKSGIIPDFIRKFWDDKDNIIQKPTVSLLDINIENQHLAFLFPQKKAGDLMIEYYNWCIRNCPEKTETGMINTYKVLTRWGE